MILVLIEQILLLFPGSYPYTLGMPVKFIPVNLKEEEVRGRLADSLVRFRYRVNESCKEVYFINSLTAGTLGPRLFVGQILFEGKGRVIIRMAPISFLGIAYLFLGAIGTLKLSGFIYAFLIAVLVYFFYRSLVGKLGFLH